MPAFQISVPVQATRLALDEIKGLAILLIVLYHAGGVLVWNNYLHGDVGVDMFLLLSGFGLAFSAKDESAKVFFFRRFIRLFPAYWVVLTVFLVCNIKFLQLKYSVVDVVTHYLGIHALLGEQFAFTINNSFWFISAILLCYVLYWLLKPLIDVLDRYLFWVGLISAGVALLLFFAVQPGLMGHLGFRLPSFFLGVIAGHLLLKGSITLSPSVWAGLGLLLLGYVPYTRGITFYSVFVGIAIIAAYAWVAQSHLSRVPAVPRFLAFLGRYSLEIFLIHQPLMREYNYHLHGRWLNEPSPSAFSLGVGMAIAISVTLLASVELSRLQRVVFRR